LLGKFLIIEDVVEALKDLFDLDDFFAEQFFDGSAYAQKSCKYFKSNKIFEI
jgi:hypothetical protein